MRLDKFLKVTRIIKRRTIAQELCSSSKVLINNDAKKPSYEMKKGDKIKVYYYDQELNFEVLDVPVNNVKKEDIEKYIKIG